LAIFKKSAVFRALHYRDFFWFWISYFVSNIGSWMQNVAQGWLLFEMTNSPFYLGLFSLSRTVLLFCFFLLGGLMADRWNRRLVMIWIQVVSLATAFVMAMMVSFDAIRVWHIFVLGAITSTAWAFEQPVRQSLLPQLVSREDLGNALALNAITWHGAGLLGPSLVGFLFGWIGTSGCFYLNAISYFAVIAALVPMRIPVNTGAGTARITDSLLAGLAYIRQQKLILTLLIGSSLFSIFGRSYITLLPVFAKEVLRVGASGLGFIAAAPGLGTIIGSLSLAALSRIKANRRSLVLLLLGSSGALILFATTHNFATAFMMLVMVGGSNIAFDTLVNTAIQLSVADVYRGRVLGVYGLATAGLRELGGMQAGFVAEWTTTPFALEAGAVVVVLMAVFFFGPRLRGLPQN